jgi:hypothetical protein
VSAAFWERNPSQQSLMGAMLNLDKSVGHAHKEVNAIYIAAYGEHVLVNSGYYLDGFPAIVDPKGTFDYRWFRYNARSANTVLIDNRDHDRKTGGGIKEGIIADHFDYASGSSGDALQNGHHQRNFVFVHPQDGCEGYYLLFDEISASGAGHDAHVLLHPMSDDCTVVSANTEYRWTINGPYLRQSNHPVYLTVYQATSPDSVYLKDGAIAVNSSNHFVTKYIESLYDTGSSAKKNIVTIICPHDADHNRPGISRLTGSGTTGGAVNHPGNITDYALESGGTGEVSNNGATFQGIAALYRKQNNDLKFYFVRKGRRFDSGDSPEEGFAASADVSIYMRDDTGQIVSSGSDVTLYYPGITGVTLNTVAATLVEFGPGWVTVTVPPGKHEVKLLAGGEGSFQ